VNLSRIPIRYPHPFFEFPRQRFSLLSATLDSEQTFLFVTATHFSPRPFFGFSWEKRPEILFSSILLSQNFAVSVNSEQW
jgi:hypothetical protein